MESWITLLNKKQEKAQEEMKNLEELQSPLEKIERQDSSTLINHKKPDMDISFEISNVQLSLLDNQNVA